MVIRKLIRRNILARKGRAILTLLSIVIGVAAVVSVSIASRTTDRAYRDMFAAVTGRAQLEIVSETGGSFEKGLLDKIRQAPGVASAVPMLQRYTKLAIPDGQGGSRQMQIQALGIDPAGDAAVRDYEVAEGTFGGGGKSSGLLMETSFAKGLGVRVGDPVKMLTPRGWKTVAVTGLLRFRGMATLRLGGLAFLHLRKAQFLFGAKDELDIIQVVLKDGVMIQQARTALQAIVPQGVLVRQPGGGSELADETLLASRQGLDLATLLSSILAAFIILNTFLMNVGERRRQLAIMRAVGATRWQIASLLCIESVIMGVIGTVLGCLLGLYGARELAEATSSVLQIHMPPMDLSLGPFLMAVVYGLGISMAGVLFPAWRAWQVSPMEGLGHAAREDIEGHSHHFTVIGVLVCLLSGGALVGCLVGWLPIDASTVSGGGLLIGLVCLLPLLLGSLSWVVMEILALLRVRGEARLARRQILRHYVRSVLTMGVLFLAAAMGTGLASAILDNVENIRQWRRQALAGDFFLRAMVPDMSNFHVAPVFDEVDPKVRAVTGTEFIDAARFVQVQLGNLKPVVIVREFSDPKMNYFDLSQGDRAALRGQLEQGQVVVGTVLAQKLHKGLGDTITLNTPRGPRELRIAGLANEYLGGGLAIYLHRKPAERLLDLKGVDAYMIKCLPGRRAEVEKQLHRIADEYGLLVHSYGQVSDLIDGMIKGIDGCLWGILILGAVVASFGVVNTLTMNVLEQTRELGLLRIVAMTRRQVRRTIFSQAAIIGVIGLLPGVAAGLAVAYLINLATLPVLGHPVEFHARWELLVGTFCGGLAIVVASAWFPARRAARLALLDALQYE